MKGQGVDEMKRSESGHSRHVAAEKRFAAHQCRSTNGFESFRRSASGSSRVGFDETGAHSVFRTRHDGVGSHSRDCSNAWIMPLKVFNATGRGTSFRIAKAIVYAVNSGASVINMSFGLEMYSDLVDDAVDYASRNEVILVASVGNTNSKVSKIYPAANNKVVGVAATRLEGSESRLF
jgi:hypothetical protein